MISDSSVVPIGQTLKTHGINGELVAIIDSDIDPDNLKCLMMVIDGIYVPFFISEWRSRSAESILVKFDGIDSQQHAEAYTGLTLYAPVDTIPLRTNDTDGLYASDFIGWTITDDGRIVGIVVDYDDSTENLLFKLSTPDGGELLIPVADPLINSLDTQSKIMDMNLPSGL